MKKPRIKTYTLGFTSLATLILAGCSTVSIPDVTPEGLIRVDAKRADVVYVQPGASLASYTKYVLIEPNIAFRSGWQADTNSDRMMDRISDSDMEEMIEIGKRLLVEEFVSELEKGGYQLTEEAGSDTLAIKPSIIDLDIFAPDADGMADIWTTTYSDGSGKATLMLELYDSKSQELLVRAWDKKSNEYDGYSWRFSRSRATNIQDARAAFGSWAKMFVKGMNQAKEAPFPDALPSESEE